MEVGRWTTRAQEREKWRRTGRQNDTVRQTETGSRRNVVGETSEKELTFFK